MPDNLSGGTTVSLLNTPQAKDDYYKLWQDTGIQILDVMSNDLGGNAKTLWSIDNTSDSQKDLIWKDSVGLCELSKLGARISVRSDGKINYDTSIFRSLPAGQRVVDQFTYAIRLANGTLSWATVSVTMTGTNDVPTVTAALTSTAAEGAAAYALDLLAGASDADSGETATLSVASVSYAVNGGASSTTAPAGVSLTGSTLNVDPTNAAFNGLAFGQSAIIVVSYNVVDAQGATVAQTQTVTITGTNDAPVVAATIVDQSSTEDVTWNFTVPEESFSDADQGTTLNYTATLGNGSALPIWLTFNAATRTFSGTPPLNFNGTIDLKVTASDGSLSASDTFSLTINPVDDRPVNTLPASFATNEDTSVQLTGLSVADVDAAGGTIGVTLSVASGTLTAASGGGVTVTGSTTGTLVLSGTLAAINAYLASAASPIYVPVANANGAVTLTMTTSDNGNTGAGGPLTDVDISTINIAAVNDAGIDLVFTYTGPPGNSLPNGAFGQITAVDPDGGGATTFSITNLAATTLSGGAATGFAGDITITSTGAISANNLDDNRIYEVTVQVLQGSNTFSEVFSIITGTNAIDTVGGAAANGDDVIFAQGAADIILAGSGNDTVFGQSNNDQIHGGTGNDTLTGGGGDDRFFFNTALDPILNVDKILDFSANTADTIGLDNDIFTAFGTTTGTLNAANFAANVGGNATDANDFILYDTATGNVYYDADGNGAGVRILFATLDLTGSSGTVNASDFFLI